MLEGILLTVVLGYVFSYVALRVIYFLFDRPESPESRQRWIQEILKAPLPSQEPEHTESPRPY